MSRNLWILVGVGVVAFLGFVLFEGGEDGTSGGGGSGSLGLFRGGGERSTGDVGAGSVVAGGRTPAEERRLAEARAKKRLMKSRPGAGGPPDPELLKRIQSGGGGLVATGPAQAPRGGLVRQSFRGGMRVGSAGDGTQIAGGTGEDDPGDPEDCGAPRIEKMVVDLQVRPEMRVAFDVPSQNDHMRNGLGERFSIGGAPAFVTLLPNKNSSAGAIFDDRFLVLIRGRCIPSRAYVKALLRQ